MRGVEFAEALTLVHDWFKFESCPLSAKISNFDFLCYCVSQKRLRLNCGFHFASVVCKAYCLCATLLLLILTFSCSFRQ